MAKNKGSINGVSRQELGRGGMARGHQGRDMVHGAGDMGLLTWGCEHTICHPVSALPHACAAIPSARKARLAFPI